MADRPDSDDHTDENALTNSGDGTQVTSATVANPVGGGDRMLTREEFQGLAEMPPELEWFANITNANTRRAYKGSVAGGGEMTR